MNAKTAKALEESIAHWRRNVEAQTPDEASTGPSACSLCEMFVNAPGITEICVGCPIHEAGYHACSKTPYESAERALLGWLDPKDIAARGDFRRHALEELAFLESLREEPKA